MHKLLGVVYSVLFSVSSFALDWSEVGDFSGTISRINKGVGLIRIRVDFENQKYLNKRDKVEFYVERYRDRACLGYIKGKTNKYILLRVPNYKTCSYKLNFTVGAYVKMYSPDLVNNLKVGHEIVNLLLKKRLALDAKLRNMQKELETYIEKVEAVNQRYQTLRSKLELEWQKELSDIEEDKSMALQTFKSLQTGLNEVDHKLQQYRVMDSNMELDRWALDRKLYQKK